jgi:DNA-binding SARP family transcriptional activator
MKAVQDFNYKVDLAEGLKHLKAGKLRLAEDRFRRLITRTPTADGGYRGLARVQVELGDRAAALATLREGAAALSRAGERAIAIDMLREATTLDPLDLSAHRRLAAALALAGDVGASAAEYDRFANAEIAAGDPDRAKLEASYALETLGEIPALHELARTVGLQLRTAPRRLAPEPVSQPAAVVEAEPLQYAAEHLSRASDSSASEVGMDPRLAWTMPEPAPAQPPGATSQPAARTVTDPLVLEERAMALIAARDARAGPEAVAAASALAAGGKINAASDLLLALVASGVAVHDAERELISVARALGRNELAEERERLLGEAVKLG